MNRRENVYDPQQTLITNFYQLTVDITAELNKLSTENQFLKKMLQKLCDAEKSKKNPPECTTDFLSSWDVVERKNKTKHGRIGKYDDNLKQFCTYLYVIAGKFVYQTLSANLCLPSVATVKHNIQSSNNTIIEGCVRVKELSHFLAKWNLERQVWFSEDGTKVVNKIQFDESTDQIVGFRRYAHS